MQSCLYEGTLRHRRLAAPRREFTYSLFMVYLDLGELESAFAGRLLWSTKTPNVAWFRREDHLGDPGVSLENTVRDLVAEHTGARPTGPIRLLTHLRYLGYCFNPVSFYYCFDAEGLSVDTIVAEVSNTPWGERHAYVLTEVSNLGRGDTKSYAFKKAFHVSPFQPMDLDYGWRFGSPDRTLWVRMESSRDGEAVFDATLSLTRRPIGRLELARATVLYPFMTVKVIAAIYSQALRLWLRGAPFHAHPGPRTHEVP